MANAPRPAKTQASGNVSNPPGAVTTTEGPAHDRGGDGATQAMHQEQDAVQQMGPDARLQINEGGRTNDSHERSNPDGAVHGLPKPALKGTWR